MKSRRAGTSGKRRDGHCRDHGEAEHLYELHFDLLLLPEDDPPALVAVVSAHALASPTTASGCRYRATWPPPSVVVQRGGEGRSGPGQPIIAAPDRCPGASDAEGTRLFPACFVHRSDV